MKDHPRILVLTGSLGEGHRQAASALLEAARLFRPNLHVEVIDFTEWSYPHLHVVAKRCYYQCIKHFPSIYGYLFRKTRKDNVLSYLLKRTSSLVLSRLLKLLNQTEPDVVVSTFPAAAAAMSALKSHGLTDVPTVTIITDHTDHSYWIHPNTEQYIVGSDYVREALLNKQINDSQIAVTGIPIHLDYYSMPDRNRLFKQYGLDREARTVLVMGGGFGMIGKSLTSLLNSEQLPDDLQFIIVCGQNEKLRKHLTTEAAGFRHRVHIFGYIDYVRELMAVSDMIVTKPGGLTTSEAMAAELPMILFHPLPGQEQDNCEYLLREGVAVLAEDDVSLFARLSELLDHPDRLQEMKSRANRCKYRAAALEALKRTVETSKYSSGRLRAYIRQYT
jgi:processive 1,2-diacylglycerol beta-glucosyltransferase